MSSQVRDEDFERAAKSAHERTQYGAATPCERVQTLPNDGEKNSVLQGVTADCSTTHEFLLAPRGSELSPLATPKTPIPEIERTREDTVDVKRPPSGPVQPCPEQPPSDPDLALIVGRWSELPEATRSAVLAIVRGATGNVKE